VSVDGDDNNMKWVAIIGSKPGEPLELSARALDMSLGISTEPNARQRRHSGTTLPPNDSTVIADFEGTGTFADLGRTPSGDLIGYSPANGTLPGQNPVTGCLSERLVNKFLNVDTTTGTLTSKSFTISNRYIK
jgi:beta-fructofuranosidase/levanase